jgi:hypothetical protein
MVGDIVWENSTLDNQAIAYVERIRLNAQPCERMHIEPA